MRKVNDIRTKLLEESGIRYMLARVISSAFPDNPCCRLVFELDSQSHVLI
jgi:hypothetical protein